MKFSLTLAGLLSATNVLAAPSPDMLKREISDLHARAGSLNLEERANLASLESRATPSRNNSREYQLRSELKPNQPNKARFNDLWLFAYHTGAGLDDGVFSKNRDVAAKGFLNSTKTITGPNGQKFSNQEFDLGSSFPFEMIPETYVVGYSSWQPVRIDAGAGGASQYSGFFINGTGLQWSSEPKEKKSYNEFGGWVVCDWWHPSIDNGGAFSPQLFIRLAYEGDGKLPATCADINLIPEYI